MAKTYKKISGTWKPIKYIYKNISGTWTKMKYAYKKVSGTWQKVYANEVNYTFTSSITASSSNGILLSSYVNPNDADTFNITVNSGVTLQGKTGATGATGAAGNPSIRRTNCYNAFEGNGGDGGAGGTGGYGIDFSGFSGKTINIINNGTIKSGNGGNGGNGGDGYKEQAFSYNCSITYGGCGGAGGNGGSSWAYNTSGVTINISGNSTSTGSSGATGSKGSDGNIYCSNSCFTKGQKVLMANNTYKNIEDIKVGEKVLGAYGFINTVQYIQRPLRGSRVIWDVDGLLQTSEHGILNGNKDGFLYISMETGASEYGTYEEAFDENGKAVKVYFEGLKNTKREQLCIGSKVASQKGTREITKINATDRTDKYVYHILVDGDMTYCIENTFVSSFASDSKFDYIRGERLK